MRKMLRHLVFQTPAFISGADQNVPEIRSASVRGALRWWFRLLGGTKTEEAELFGKVHGGTVASKVIVRVKNPHIDNNLEKLPCKQNTTNGYLTYFAAVSGNEDGIFRTEARHYIGVGSSFDLEIVERFPVMEVRIWNLLEEAVTALCRLGTLGYRSTRGFGMLAEKTPPPLQEFETWAASLKSRGIYLFRIRDRPQETSARSVQVALGDILKDLRHEEDAFGERYSSKNSEAQAFGSADPRSASALRLCPVKTRETVVPVLMYSDNACGVSSLLDVVKRYGLTHLDAF